MPDGKGIAQAMQQDLGEVGVNAKLVTYEWGTYLERTGSGDHSMALLGWDGDNGDPDNFLNVLLGSASATETDALNIAYYKNPEVDKLLLEGPVQHRGERARAGVYEGPGAPGSGRPVGPYRLRQASSGLCRRTSRATRRARQAARRSTPSRLAASRERVSRQEVSRLWRSTSGAGSCRSSRCCSGCPSWCSSWCAIPGDPAAAPRAAGDTGAGRASKGEHGARQARHRTVWDLPRRRREGRPWGLHSHGAAGHD